MSSGMLLTRCPYHEDSTPSLGVYKKPDQHFYCFGCRARGSWRELWETLGSPSHVALAPPDRSESWFDRPRWGSGTPLDEYAERSYLALITQPHLLWYPKDRGIDGVIVQLGLGWDDGWMIVPVTNERDKVVGVVGRAYPHIAHKTNMRYDLPRGQSPLMYVPDWELWKTAEVHYVVFGVLDAISMVVAGLAASSPTAGKASFDPEWLDSIDTTIVVVPDRGEESAAFDLAAGLDWRARVHLPEYEDGEDDPNDILVKRGSGGLRHATQAIIRSGGRSRVGGPS